MIHFALRRVAQHALAGARRRQATPAPRRRASGPCIVWFTGLSGAGKSTIANLVERKLHALGRHTYLLDGDNVRHGLNRDLGFTEADRVENIRRVAEVGAAHGRRRPDRAGLRHLAVSQRARDGTKPGRGRENLLRSMSIRPLAVAEARDVKGLYAKARRGELTNFTGVDSPLRATGHAGNPHRHDGDGRRGSCEAGYGASAFVRPRMTSRGSRTFGSGLCPRARRFSAASPQCTS